MLFRSAAVMVNSDNGQIINEIIQAIAKEYQWEDFLPQPLELVSVDPAKLDDYTGRFLVNTDDVLTVTKENGKLYGKPPWAPKFELFAISENAFTRRDEDHQFAFARGEGGKVDSVRIRFDSETVEARRLDRGEVSPYEQLIAGKFAEAIEAYKKIKREKPDDNAVAEERLNYIGYSLLEQKISPPQSPSSKRTSISILNRRTFTTAWAKLTWRMARRSLPSPTTRNRWNSIRRIRMRLRR